MIDFWMLIFLHSDLHPLILSQLSVTGEPKKIMNLIGQIFFILKNSDFSELGDFSSLAPLARFVSCVGTRIINFCTHSWCVRLHLSFRMNCYLALVFSSGLLLVFLRVLLRNECCRFFACFNHAFCCMFSCVSCKSIYAFIWLLCAFFYQNI